MKKTDRLTDALNDIGDDLIRDAEDNVPVILKKKKNGWVKWVALAASILLIALAVPVGIFAARGYQSSTSAAEITDRKSEGKSASTLPVSVEPTPKDAPGFIDGVESAYYSARDKDGHVSAEIPARDPADPRYPTEEGKQRPVPEPGMLTAAAWDDNLHYSQWLALFAEFNEKQEPGKFRDTDAYSYRLSDWGLATDRRITVTVRYGGAPVADAYVKLDGNGTVVNARTNANGIAYLFADPAGTLTVKSGQISLSGELNGRTEVEVSLLLSEQSPVSGSAPEPASPA
ncbi:MAG: hypothetical protein IKY02_04905, partial [Lachnospiraceae bacterium]|nr:hypothetical protein [Lachnospiraceae bacterium]